MIKVGCIIVCYNHRLPSVKFCIILISKEIAFFVGGAFMKIVIAPDSFKGSLTAVEAAKSIECGIKKVDPATKTVSLPVGDGGEGTMDALISATGGQTRSVMVTGPLGNQVEAAYGILGDGKTCVIEMATASGLHLVPEERLSPLQTTTYGTGQLIKQALDDGFSSLVISVGGSATNDAGVGMLQALGLQLLDNEEQAINYGGGELSKIFKIDSTNFDQRIKKGTFIIASDVKNPLIGTDGASYVFGPQKGATEKDLALLDGNLTHWADEVKKVTGLQLHDRPGAGAAGGIGGAFQAFFPVQMERGIDVVLDYVNLDRELKDADLVITGEGKVDHQTASGKTPLGIAQAAANRNVPTIIMAGTAGEGFEFLFDHGVVSVNSIIRKPMTIAEATENAAILLEESTEQVIRTFSYYTINGREGLSQ